MVERSRRRRYLASIGALGFGVSVAGCTGGGRGDGGGGGTVDMTDGLAFEPSTLSVAVGDAVTWRTVGSVGHTVAAYDGEVPPDAASFASGGFESEDAAREASPREPSTPTIRAPTPSRHPAATRTSASRTSDRARP